MPVGTKAGQNDGRARGTLDLNAPRIGADDVAVTVNGTPVIQGAKTIAVNAFRSYADAPLADLPDVSGYRPQLITQGYLDGIDGDSQAFINAALGNATLRSRLSGLGSYHLRPGVEIVSDRNANPHGDLTIDGDLDLSGYRYGPDADRNDPARRGYGEPGRLVIRAAGGLNVHGSINDGFAPPAATPDDNGWVLAEARFQGPGGSSTFGGDIVVPIDGVVLDTGTRFPAGSTLNYSVGVAAMTLPAGTVLPVDAELAGALNLSAGTVVAANIYNADGSVAYAAGTVLRTAAARVSGRGRADLAQGRGAAGGHDHHRPDPARAGIADPVVDLDRTAGRPARQPAPFGERRARAQLGGGADARRRCHVMGCATGGRRRSRLGRPARAQSDFDCGHQAGRYACDQGLHDRRLEELRLGAQRSGLRRGHSGA